MATLTSVFKPSTESSLVRGSPWGKMAPNAGAFRERWVCLRCEGVWVCGHSCVHMCVQRVYAYANMCMCVSRVCSSVNSSVKCPLNVLSLWGQFAARVRVYSHQNGSINKLMVHPHKKQSLYTACEWRGVSLPVVLVEQMVAAVFPHWKVNCWRDDRWLTCVKLILVVVCNKPFSDNACTTGRYQLGLTQTSSKLTSHLEWDSCLKHALIHFRGYSSY